MFEFNNTTNLNGLVQLYEAEMGFDYGYVSGSTERLKEFAAQVNIALYRYNSIALSSGGLWEADDYNHSDYSIIYSPITSGRRSYPFTTDENNNLIMDIYKVLIYPSTTATEYKEIYPVDENQSRNISIISEGLATGTPTSYGKRNNAIHFDVIPNYTRSLGIKMLVNRSPSYFVYNDTTKKVGYVYNPEYFYLKPAYEKARQTSDSRFLRLESEILKLEGDPLTGKVGLIAKAFSNRRKDEVDSISGEEINSI